MANAVDYFLAESEIMKKPWLLTTKGQRASLAISYLLSVALLVALWGFAAGTASRDLSTRQLDPKQIDYCNIEDCPPIEKLAGLELVQNPAPLLVSEGKWFTTIELKFVNHGRLYGARELRLVVRSEAGKIVEMAKQIVDFRDKGPLVVDFTFTGSADELANSSIQLGY